MFSVAINKNMVSQGKKARSVPDSHDASALPERKKNAPAAVQGPPRATPSTERFVFQGGTANFAVPPSFSPVRRRRPAVCEVRSLTALVKQIAVHTLRWGYWWYVSGIIPEHKDAKAIDRRLMDKYAANLSEASRYRRKQQGLANTRYYRLGRRFFLLSPTGI